MPRPKFPEGHKKMGGIKKGQKQKKTIIKETLGDKIKNLDSKLYELSKEFLSDKSTKLTAWKELMKYRLPTNQKISGDEDNPVKIEIEVRKYL